MAKKHMMVRKVAPLLAAACLLILVPGAASADVSSAGPSSRFTFYTVPTTAALPCVSATGTDGAVWFQEAAASKIGRIDPATGRVSEYPIPWSAGSRVPEISTSLPSGVTPLGCAIEPGPDGKMYFTNGTRNQLGRIDTGSGRIELFQAPAVLGNLVPFNDLTPDSRGAIWFTQTTANAIGRFDIARSRFETIPVPTPLALPIGIYAASDGGIWFTEAAAGKIGRIDAATRRVEEIRTPNPVGLPFVIRAETAGRLWFTELAGSIGRLDMATRQITEFPVPTPAALPVAVCAASDGGVYFGRLGQDLLGRVDATTGQIAEIPIPGSVASAPAELSCGPGESVWFVQVTANRIGRYATN